MSHAIPLKRPPSITSEIVRLTPSDAKRMLDLNVHNRPLNERDILKWATEMEAGRWQLNGEAIKVSADNRVLDGQHRLHALSLLSPGSAIEFLVIRGLPPETQTTMDQGRKRSAADQLHLAGVESDKSLAAAIRFYLIWTEGLLFVDNKAASAQITTTKIVEWSTQNPDVVELIRRGALYRGIRARNALIYALYARIAEVNNTEVADEFFVQVKDGAYLATDSPILALRNRLDRIAGDSSSGRRIDATRMADRDVAGFFITAFNAWANDVRLQKLQRPKGGSWTRHNFPQITVAS